MPAIPFFATYARKSATEQHLWDAVDEKKMHTGAGWPRVNHATQAGNTSADVDLKPADPTRDQIIEDSAERRENSAKQSVEYRKEKNRPKSHAQSKSPSAWHGRLTQVSQ
jgi:hypothetical protein